jgi:hypothetical protein
MIDGSYGCRSGILFRKLQHQKVSLEGETMQNLKWILIAVGVLMLGSAAVSLAPDIRRYARMRAM